MERMDILARRRGHNLKTQCSLLGIVLFWGMIRRYLFSVALIVVLLGGCQDERREQGKSDGPLLELLPASHTRVLFANEVFEDAERHIGGYDYLYNGGGVAIGDLNNDGLPDLFFTGNSVPNKLYFNKGNFKFEDVTEAAGILGEHWSTGVSMAS